MTTTFALLCQACGLSHREAAVFLDVRPDTVKSWSAGRNGTPDQVLVKMSALYARIEDAADAASDLIDAQDGSGEIELGLAADDHEAQSLGWPCVGAHRAVLAIVSARATDAGHSVAIVPRGATVATAAASDVHGQ